MDANIKMIGKILLIIGGLIHLIPQLYNWLADLLNYSGYPIIQVIIGLLSIIIGIMWFMEK